MKVVVAPDSFKGSLAAEEAAAAIATGWLLERPGDDVVLRPQADGGEGTCVAVERSVAGARRRSIEGVHGPDGRAVDAWWLVLPDGTAVVELALCAGLPLMARPDPLNATTRGLGQVLRAALERGATRIVVALGGSASTDGATGALAELGARWIDREGRDLPDGGGYLHLLDRADLSGLLPAPPGGVEVLTDVANPLHGLRGAAATFGPQKGASPEDVEVLDRGLQRLSELIGGRPNAPGAGAAGGCAYGLATAWNARIVPGAPRIADLSGLVRELGDANALLTGEGHFDDTSLDGKVAGYALDLAAGAGVWCAVVAGRVAPQVRHRANTCELAGLAGSAHESLRDPVRYLRAAGLTLARQFTDRSTRVSR